MTVIEMDPKPTLRYTPLFLIYTVVMGYAFMYSFALALAHPDLYGSFMVFMPLYIVGWIWLLFGVKFKEERTLDQSTIFMMILWIIGGLSVLVMLNVITSLILQAVAFVGLSVVWIDTTIHHDYWLAWLAGYCEEIAFGALTLLLGRLTRSLKLTLFVIACFFPLWHIISQPIITTLSLMGIAVFFLLMSARVVLTTLYFKTDRIEIPITVHFVFDAISITVYLLTSIATGAI